MGRRRGAALSDLGGQTPATLRAFQGFPMVMPHPAMTTTSLLLVEDDEFVRLSLARALNPSGVFAVLPAETGQHADELQRSLSPATVGRMAGITLFGFLQLIEVEQKTGLIVVRAAGEEGRIYFDHGRPAHAETRLAHGPAAVYEIVRWTDPKLEI